MKWTSYTSRQETYVNLLLWALMLAIPTVGALILSQLDDYPNLLLRDLVYMWKPMLVILAAFLIHNYFIAPILIYQRNLPRYLVAIVVLIILFSAYQCTAGPPAKPYNGNGNKTMPTEVQGQRTISPQAGVSLKKAKPIAGPHEFTMFSLLIFALGANLGIKLYFKTQSDQQRMVELEKENLRQELNYLRYQVNPHFLMNTLNNIHALVDIDPKKAKSSIVQLSKFMRYLLYECETDFITMEQGIALIKNYNALMGMRYTDLVDIRFTTPEQIPKVLIAPLIALPFIENAFKHGVSYNKPSFIHMSIRVEAGRLHFECRNSKNEVNHDHGGVGLSNVIKRMDLIYPNLYTLDIDDGEEAYTVRFSIPAYPQESSSPTPSSLTAKQPD